MTYPGGKDFEEAHDFVEHGLRDGVVRDLMIPAEGGVEKATDVTATCRQCSLFEGSGQIVNDSGVITLEAPPVDAPQGTGRLRKCVFVPFEEDRSGGLLILSGGGTKSYRSLRVCDVFSAKLSASSKE